MNKVYSFAIKLQDMFTPTMMKLSQTYERRIGVMERMWTKFRSSITSAQKPLDLLRRGLMGIKENVRLRINTSELDTANTKLGRFYDKLGRLREANGRFASTGRSSSGGKGGNFFDSILNGVGLGAGFAGFESIKAGAQRLGQMSMGSGMDLQAERYVMTKIMGEQVTNQLERQLKAYAPDRLAELMASGKQMYGAGITDNLFGELQKVNNLAALSNANVGELAYIQSKIRATGYLQGDEMDMYRERGINLNPYIAQVMGVNESAIKKLQEKGLITYDVFSKALDKYVGPNSKFATIYEDRKKETAKGAYEFASGRLQNKLAEFGENKLLPLITRGANLVTKILDMSGGLEIALSKVWNGLARVGGGVEKVFMSLGLFSKEADTATNIVNLLTSASNTVSVILDKVGGILEFLSRTHIPAFVLGLYAINKVLVLLSGSWLAFNGAVALSPIGAVAASFLALAAAIGVAYAKFEPFRNMVIDAIEGLKVFFSGVGTAWEMFKTGGITGLMKFSDAMDRTAERRGNMAILQDKYDRLHNGVTIQDRRNRRRQSQTLDPLNPTAGSTLTGSGVPGGGLGAAAGLSATVGNSKSQSITINLASLINHSEITVMDWNEAEMDLETKIIDALARIAQSAGKLAY